VFPSQEEELAISNIVGQYEALGKLLENIPNHIQIIMLPGNHDGVRLSEPQPALPAQLIKAISVKAMYVGNPCLMTLEGVRVLAYHGKGLDDYVGNVGKVSYSQPAKIMAEMLKRRHLCPIYGGKTQISPERTDYLVIETVPDIFVTGHIHAAAAQRYDGVLTINASTWQDQTPYQAIHNIQPDPGRVTVVDLDTLNYEVKRFY